MFFGHLPDHLILFPTRAPIDAGGAVRKTIRLESGEVEIWTAKSRRAQEQGRTDIFILRFYGNADRADRWARGPHGYLGLGRRRLPPSMS